MLHTSFVYILASKYRGALYIGVTNDLCRRVYEHKHYLTKGFTHKYFITRLVYFETYDDISDAIHREKQVKKWHREWKINLIEKSNPTWKDLYLHQCEPL